MMLSRKNMLVKVLLWPFSLIYGAVVAVRNFCFDAGIMRAKMYDMPIISVGNLTVGGTGKTPHTEYLIRLLSPKYRVATLSRGYGRKTKGFLLSDMQTSAHEMGDEPCQMKRKFPDVTVAVAEKRCEGVEQLMLVQPPLEVVLLDDAYQHRYIKPGLSILLIDYNRPIMDDNLLPMGNLRESAANVNRADMLVVTKCPQQLSAVDALQIKKSMKIDMMQDVFFTTFRYGDLLPFADTAASSMTMDMLRDKHVLLLTGIASPQSMREHLEKYAKKVRLLPFSDHHDFNEKDIRMLCESFASIESDEKIIVTTEKDAVRLAGVSLPAEVKCNMYTLGVEVAFLLQKEEVFNRKILSYVEENRRGR